MPHHKYRLLVANVEDETMHRRLDMSRLGRLMVLGLVFLVVEATHKLPCCKRNHVWGY